MKKFEILKSTSIIEWLRKWKRRYSKREKKKKILNEKTENIITEKVGKKRNLQKNNKEEYLYNTNLHIKKIEKKHWSNYH